MLAAQLNSSNILHQFRMVCVIGCSVLFSVCDLSTTAAQAEDVPRQTASTSGNYKDPNKLLTEIFTLGDIRFRHSATITSISPIPARQQLITTARDATARLWDMKTGKEIRRFYHAEDDGVWNSLIHPDQKSFFTTNSDGKVRRWDLDSGEVISTYDTGSRVIRVAIFPDHKRIVAVGDSGAASIWDIESVERIERLRPRLDDLYGVDVDPKGRWIVTCGEKGAIVWSTDDWSELYELTHDDEDVCTARFSPDGSQIATCDDDGVLRIFDAESGVIKLTEDLGDTTKVLDWSPNGKLITVSDTKKGLVVYNIAQQKITKRFHAKLHTIWPVSFSADGSTVLSSATTTVFAFRLKDAKFVSAALDSRDQRGSFLKLKPLGISTKSNRMIVKDSRYNVQWYDLSSGEVVRTEELRREGKPVPKQVAGTVDGSRIAVLYQPPVTESSKEEEVMEVELLEELELELGDGGIVPLQGADEGADESVEEDAADPEPEETGEFDDLIEQIENIDKSGAIEKPGEIEKIDVFRVMLVHQIKSPDKLRIVIYDGEDFSKLKSFILPIGAVDSSKPMRFIDEGKKLLLWLTATRFQIWDVETAKIHWDYEVEGDSSRRFDDVYPDSFSPYFLATHYDDTVEVLDAKSKGALGVLSMKKSEVTDCCFLSGAGGMLLSEKSDGGTIVSYWKGRGVDRGRLTEAQILEQIKRMSGASYSEREAAMETLIKQGPAVLKSLNLPEDSDAETKYRFVEIRKEVQRGAFPRTTADQKLKFERPVSSIAISRDTTRFALILGNDANAEVCFGTVSSGGLQLKTRFNPGHSPLRLEFSYDGSMLFSENRNGSVTAWRIRD